jgi:hypothetical protein
LKDLVKFDTANINLFIILRQLVRTLERTYSDWYNGLPRVARIQQPH